MKQLKLRIEKPCSTSTENFYPVGSGYYCTLCQKEVQNFTHYSDRELLERISDNTDISCGIFRTDQLDKKIKQTEYPQEFSLAGLLLSGFLLTTEMSLAQSGVPLDSMHTAIRDTLAQTDTLEASSSDTSLVAGDSSAVSDTLASHDVLKIQPEYKNLVVSDYLIVSGNMIITYGGFGLPARNPGILDLNLQDTSSKKISGELVTPKEKRITSDKDSAPAPEKENPQLHPLWVWIDERRKKLFETEE